MVIKCAWCDAVIGHKNFTGEDRRLPPVTHSICRSCQTELLRDMTFHAPPKTPSKPKEATL